MKRNLVYRKSTGAEIRIHDTPENRKKAEDDGFKLITVIEWGKTSKAKGNKK